MALFFLIFYVQMIFFSIRARFNNFSPLFEKPLLYLVKFMVRFVLLGRVISGAVHRDPSF